MSLAYLDPGNLESDLQQGAYTGYTLVWVLFWATVMGLVLQEMSARLALVSGSDLAQMVRLEYPRWLNYIIYVMMEIAVVAADIQEVVGSAIAIYLVTGGYVPVIVGCLITACDTFTFLAVQYFGVRYLEALICVLVSTMAVCFFVNWGKSSTDVGNLLYGWVVPTVPAYGLTQAVSTIGAVVMPHNLYLHSGLVLSRKVNRSSKHKVNDAIWYARIESAGALLVSFLINLALVAPNANSFFSKTCAETPSNSGPFACISRAAWAKAGSDDSDGQGEACILRGGGAGVCSELGLLSEGYALQHAFNNASLYIWAIGLLAAGQAATMTCTYAGQVIMGGCLQIRLAPWKRTALTRLFAIGPALAVAASTYNNQSLFNNINEYLNVLQSVQLPFAMLPVLHFARQSKLLGIFASRSWLRAVSYFFAAIVMVVNVILIVQFVEDYPVGAIVGVCCYGIGYCVCCVCMLVDSKHLTANLAALKFVRS
uniref:Natural resistance-associated macrophage protein n=1 Tax=Calcidiscus leptoporus TaxID=127549 RepID=A0A7S0JAL6_9EUKA